jgi:hypothetical protein
VVYLAAVELADLNLKTDALMADFGERRTDPPNRPREASSIDITGCP